MPVLSLLCTRMGKVYNGFCYSRPSLSLCVCLQPEEYGQEAMEGQGEAMLDPEGETYDETQQVISTHHTKCIHVATCLHVI